MITELKTCSNFCHTQLSLFRFWTKYGTTTNRIHSVFMFCNSNYIGIIDVGYILMLRISKLILQKHVVLAIRLLCSCISPFYPFYYVCVTKSYILLLFFPPTKQLNLVCKAPHSLQYLTTLITYALGLA